jgi:hypothetical protein
LKSVNLFYDFENTKFVAWGLLEDFKFLNRETGLFKKLAEIDKSHININELNQHKTLMFINNFLMLLVMKHFKK